MKHIALIIFLAIIVSLLLSYEGFCQPNPCENICTACLVDCQDLCLGGELTDTCNDCLSGPECNEIIPISDHAGVLFTGGLLMIFFYYFKRKMIVLN